MKQPADRQEPVADTAALEQRVRQLTAALEQSAKELEQFAYLASHDLQEPLRKIASYLQTLEARCGQGLDEEGREFISFALGATARMQQMIDGLLVYSRVGGQKKAAESLSAGDVVDEAITDLQEAIDQGAATVTRDELPAIVGDGWQLFELFRNLLDNAIKFRKEAPPVVHVSAERSGQHWVFSIRDNGIGIHPRYADRVFQIFQRLHPRDAYPGAGIGLAICKRVVERHGGRMWFASEPGQGTTFFFTIPAESPGSSP